MKAIAKCTNIKWDFDDIDGKPPKLPKTVGIRVDVEKDLMGAPDADDLVVDLLTEKFGFCVKSATVKIVPDRVETLKWARKFLKDELADVQKLQGEGKLGSNAQIIPFFKKMGKRGLEFSFHQRTGEIFDVCLKP